MLAGQFIKVSSREFAPMILMVSEQFPEMRARTRILQPEIDPGSILSDGYW
jgi:hypothetical protein